MNQLAIGGGDNIGGNNYSSNNDSDSGGFDGYNRSDGCDNNNNGDDCVGKNGGGCGVDNGSEWQHDCGNGDYNGDDIEDNGGSNIRSAW